MPRTSLNQAHDGLLNGEQWSQGAARTGMLIASMYVSHVPQPRFEVQNSLSSPKIKRCWKAHRPDHHFLSSLSNLGWLTSTKWPWCAQLSLSSHKLSAWQPWVAPWTVMITGDQGLSSTLCWTITKTSCSTKAGNQSSRVQVQAPVRRVDWSLSESLLVVFLL